MEYAKLNGGYSKPGTSAGDNQTGVKRQADESLMENRQIKRSALEDISNSLNLLQEEAAVVAQELIDMENQANPVEDNDYLDLNEVEIEETESSSSNNDSSNLSQPEPEPEPTSYNQVATTGCYNPFPRGWDDLDRNDDPLHTWPYAMDIFNYLREREACFAINDYMPRQVHLTKWSRALLINWMVTVQQGYGMFNETLYLSVKIVDLFLCREVIEERQLQLLGATAFYIACKYEESDVLPLEELLDICDEEYDNDELLEMELKTLRNLDYDLGIPLSYRFLRRYARCASVSIRTWILGRYILELALMDYGTVGNSDSQMASAALFMALRMLGKAEHLDGNTWDETLVYYSGYELEGFARMVPALNAGLHRFNWEGIRAIRDKYAQCIHYEVAKVPLLTNQEIFRDNPYVLLLF